MKAIYFPLIPRDPAAQKDKQPQSAKITGSAVYAAGVFNALVRYSSYDVIYLPDYPRQPSGDPRDSELFTRNAGRLKSLVEHELPVMRDADELILAAPFASFAGMTRVRRLCRRPRTPITAVIHSINHANQLASTLELFLYPVRSFDALICSSSAGQQAMANFQSLAQERLLKAGFGNHQSPVKMPIIPLGIETADFSSTSTNPISGDLCISDNQVVLLYFGRFSATSKADLWPLLIVFAEIAQCHPECVLVLAGDDTHYRMAADLRRFATELGCANQVRVVANPTSRQKQDLFGAADIFVSVSDNLQETFGISVVEAMAAGLPVVASDWNGYKDLVVQGETGYLVPTFMPKYPAQFNDLRGSGRMISPDLLAATTITDTKRLAEALKMLIVNKEHRRCLGQAGRKRACNLYDWKQVIRQYETLWAALAEEAACIAENDAATYLDLDHWHYEDIFGHYPTALIDNSFRMRLTDLGRRCRRQPAILAQIAVPQTWFRVEEIERILRLFEQKETLCMEEVFDTDRQHIQGERNCMVSLSHLCRLIKYGLVDVDEADKAPDTSVVSDERYTAILK